MDNVKKRLFTLTYTLLYPAVLGAMIVQAIQGADSPAPINNANAVVVFLILYFCSQHVEATITGQFNTLWEFVFDLLEIAAIYQMFVLLSLAPSVASNPFGFSDAGFLYIVLALTLLIPVAKTLIGTGGKPGKLNFYLSIFAGALAGILIFLHSWRYSCILGPGPIK